MRRAYLLKPEVAKLRDMLKFIVGNTEETYVSLADHWDMDVQYIYDFNDLKNQKNKGNKNWFIQVREYYLELLEDIRTAELLDAVEDASDFETNGETSAAKVGDQLFRTKRNMGLDEAILRADAGRISGSYRCYVLLAPDRVAVTWVELYPMLKLPLPAFTAWRPDADGERRTFAGYYYIYERILYLIGHRIATAYPWNMIAVPVARDGEADFSGELSASTNRHAAVMTKCYLERLSAAEEEVIRKNPDAELGEKPLVEVCERLPELQRLFRGDVVRNVDRPSAPMA